MDRKDDYKSVINKSVINKDGEHEFNIIKKKKKKIKKRFQ